MGRDDRHRVVKRDVLKQLKLPLGDRDSYKIRQKQLEKGRIETTKTSARGYSSAKILYIPGEKSLKTHKVRMFRNKGKLHQGILLGEHFGPPRRKIM